MSDERREEAMATQPAGASPEEAIGAPAAEGAARPGRAPTALPLLSFELRY